MKSVSILALLAGCAFAQPAPNLHLVSQPAIYRSAQPETRQQWLYLQSLGISNVIKLNTGNDCVPGGMTVRYFPISTCKQIFGPVAPQLYAALTNVTPGTLIHCTRGVNRTGTLVILYRVKHDGWTKRKAIAEANRYGWRSTLPALKKFVKQL